MFLKRLELQGFKSFADKTILDFGSGVTAVVGPNGSGKSNISDAIRWVMGEMSAKTLRGSNMQDVIFAGTEVRKPLNYAEVSLVLDNSDHIFNLEYNEVIVTRRVFRSGETSYQINRTNCRLRDIHELFMDTGLGRDGYSIIGQGSVAQILSTKAEDRRSLFEEAAGVSKYKYKKEEATRKLASVEENLVRINDITSELEGQLGPLKHQSEKARKYLILFEEFKGLDINLSMNTLLKNKKNSDKADNDSMLVASEIESVRANETETEEKMTALYTQNREKDDLQRQKNEKLIENRSKIMESNNEISLCENTISNNNSMLERLSREISTLENNIADKSVKISESSSDQDEKETLLKKSLEELDKVQESENTLKIELSEETAELNNQKQSISEIENKIATKKERIQGIQILRDSYLERKSSITKEKESHENDLNTTKLRIKELEKNKLQTGDKLLKLKNSLEKQNNLLNQKITELNELSEKNNTKRIEFQSKSSKLRILSDMENEYDGYARSVKMILKSDEMKKLSIYGTVAGLIDVKKEYATAIEIALAGALQNIIVENEDDAKQAISFLRRTNGGRATFLPISAVKGRTLDNTNEINKCNGFIGVASELISYNSKYQGIMKNLLGRVVIVDDIDNGILMSKKFGYKFKVVTLSGDVLNSGGSMAGGSTNKTGGFLSRAAEIKTLKSELVSLEGELTKVKSEIEKQNEEIQTSKNRLSSYISVEREYENDLLRINNTLTHLTESVSQSSGSEHNLAVEEEQIERNLSDSGEQMSTILSEIRQLEKEQKEKNEQITILDNKIQELTGKKDEVSSSVVTITLSIAEIKHEIDNSVINKKSFAEEIELAKQEIETKKNDILNINNNNETLNETISQKQILCENLKNLDEEIKKQISQIDEQKKVIVEKLQEFQGANKENTERLLNLQQELSRVEARQVKLSMEKENIINHLWEEFELTYSEANDRFVAPENEKADYERHAELKKSIKALGNVNMDSMEEYKNISERFEFLSNQRNDLIKSEDNLKQIISSMQGLMEEHFTEQFSAINESFGFVFKELFGGGRGRLYLQDPDNVLETGIEIEVQLPGKGLQNLNLYSGGEKSFIAIALLFSILRIKPTPFCILDEIDAALDDVNVSRFATYLKRFADQSQFIVITHRRGSMEAANIMYGVTMQEKGVSKLLSLHMDDVDDDMAI